MQEHQRRGLRRERAVPCVLEAMSIEYEIVRA